MSKKCMHPELNPSEIYPDPPRLVKRSAILHSLTDIALAGDMPASRLFSNLTTSLERDIRGEIEREKRSMWENE